MKLPLRNLPSARAVCGAYPPFACALVLPPFPFALQPDAYAKSKCIFPCDLCKPHDALLSRHFLSDNFWVVGYFGSGVGTVLNARCCRFRLA